MEGAPGMRLWVLLVLGIFQIDFVKSQDSGALDCIKNHCEGKALTECVSSPSCLESFTCLNGCKEKHDKRQKRECLVKCAKKASGTEKVAKVLFACGKENHCFNANFTAAECNTAWDNCENAPTCKSWRTCVTENDCDPFNVACLSNCNPPMNQTAKAATGAASKVWVCAMNAGHSIPSKRDDDSGSDSGSSSGSDAKDKEMENSEQNVGLWVGVSIASGVLIGGAAFMVYRHRRVLIPSPSYDGNPAHQQLALAEAEDDENIETEEIAGSYAGNMRLTYE